MTEWAAFRSNFLANGWNARRGQGVVSHLPYLEIHTAFVGESQLVFVLMTLWFPIHEPLQFIS